MSPSHGARSAEHSAEQPGSMTAPSSAAGPGPSPPGALPCVRRADRQGQVGTQRSPSHRFTRIRLHNEPCNEGATVDVTRTPRAQQTWRRTRSSPTPAGHAADVHSNEECVPALIARTGGNGKRLTRGRLSQISRSTGSRSRAPRSRTSCRGRASTKAEIMSEVEALGFMSDFHPFQKQIEACQGEEILVVADPEQVRRRARGRVATAAAPADAARSRALLSAARRRSAAISPRPSRAAGVRRLVAAVRDRRGERRQVRRASARRAGGRGGAAQEAGGGGGGTAPGGSRGEHAVCEDRKPVHSLAYASARPRPRRTRRSPRSRCRSRGRCSTAVMMRPLLISFGLNVRIGRRRAHGRFYLAEQTERGYWFMGAPEHGADFVTVTAAAGGHGDFYEGRRRERPRRGTPAAHAPFRAPLTVPHHDPLMPAPTRPDPALAPH